MVGVDQVESKKFADGGGGGIARDQAGNGLVNKAEVSFGEGVGVAT